MDTNEMTDYEKMIDSAHQFASVISEYYKSLLENGFNEQQALQLTLAYQTSIMTAIKPK